MRIAVVLIGALGILLFFQGLSTEARPHERTDHIRATLISAGLGGVSTGRFVALSLFLTSAGLFLLIAVTGSPILGLLGGVAAGFSPWAYLRSRSRKRAEFLLEEWPDAIAGLVAAVRSGSSLAEAMLAGAHRSGPYLTGPFKVFGDAYRSSGSFTVGMEAFTSEAADPIADRLSAVLVMTHEVGGTDLVRVLRTLGDFVRADLTMRKEISARWSWTVSAARLAAAAPWLLLMVMLTQPEAARAYRSPSGAVVILFGAVASAIGYRLMLRAGRLPSLRRLGR